MNKIRLITISLAVMAIAAMTPNAMAHATQNVKQLEEEIEQHEANIKEKEASI